MSLPETTPAAAAATLAGLEAARRRSRRHVGPLWLPLVVFGALTAVGAALSALTAGAWIGGYWLVAGPPATWAVTAHHRRRARSRGFVGGRARWLGLGAGLFAACWLAASEAGLLAPVVVIPFGWLVAGRLQGTFTTARIVCVLAAVALVLAACGVAPWAALLAFGAGQVAAGLVLRSREPA